MNFWGGRPELTLMVFSATSDRRGFCSVYRAKVIRQKQFEYRARDLFGGSIMVRRAPAPHPHLALMLQDDFVAHPEPEACSSVFLGGEEGFKDVLADLRVNPRSAVGNRQPNTGLGGILPVV